MKFKNLDGQLARWLELSQYDMIIIYGKGKQHSNADALSRIPDDGECDCYRAGVDLDTRTCGLSNYPFVCSEN